MCKYKKNKSILFLTLFLSLVFVSPFFSQNIKNPKKELENKKKKINEEINEITSMLNETKASKKTSIGALVTLNIRLEKRLDLINTIKAQIQQINLEIKQNDLQIAQLKNTLEKLKREYARMIVFAQRNQDAYSALMFVFSSNNFNQAYSR